MMTPSRTARLAQRLLERLREVAPSGVGAGGVEVLLRATGLVHHRMPHLAVIGFRGFIDNAGHTEVLTRAGLCVATEFIALLTEVGIELSGEADPPREPAHLFALHLAQLLFGVAAWGALERDDPAFVANTLDHLRQASGAFAGQLSEPSTPSGHATATEDPAVAFYRLGMDARTRGEYGPAERFLLRSLTWGARSGNLVGSASAELALAKVYLRRGLYAPARDRLQHALEMGQEEGLEIVRARALHDLATIEIELEDAAAGYHLAGLAFHAYPLGDPDQISLVHDVAFAWIEQGQFSRALATLQSVVLHVRLPSHRLVVLSSLARAASGAGRVQLAARFESEALELARRLPTSCFTSQGYLNIAHGAHARAAWETAEEAAHRAYALAVGAGEAHVERAAELLLEAVRRREPARRFPQLVISEADGFAELVVRAFSSIGSARRLSATG